MTDKLNKKFIDCVRSIYSKEEIIALHRPIFDKIDKINILKTIDSNFVSTAGPFVEKFEKKISNYTNSSYAVSTINATSAIHIALKVLGIGSEDEVIAQSFSFVAAANAITYTGAKPIFIDICKDDLGLNPSSLESFLEKNTYLENGKLINKFSRKKISCCIATHIYGHPCKILKIKEICERYKIPLIEDAAESLGSFVAKKHTGTFGKIGVLSFNGNKIITTGGGGMLITDSERIYRKAKHIASTAKIPHKYEYIHDTTGYNYRLPSLNAALGYSQMEKLNKIIKFKRKLSKIYNDFANENDIKFIKEPFGTRSNYWLNTFVFKSLKERNSFLENTNKNGIMTRPAWRLMHNLKMYKDMARDDMKNSKILEKRVVNIPSSVPNNWYFKDK